MPQATTGVGSGVDALIATTTGNWIDKNFNDIVYDVYPLLVYLKANKKDVNGGEYIHIPVMYGAHAGGSFFQGYDEIPVSKQEGLGYAIYNWREYAISVAISQRDILLNQGPEGVIDIMQAKLDQAAMKAQDTFNQRFYAGNAALANAPLGLAQIIAATGTIGGISATTYTDWACQTTTAVTNIHTATSTLLTFMNQLYLKTKRGNTMIDKILTTEAGEDGYWYELNKNERYTDDPTGVRKTGTSDLKFRSASVESDRDCTSGTMYFIGKGSLLLIQHPGANFKTLDWVRGNNQVAKSTYIYQMCELVTRMRNRVGLLTFS